MKAVPLWLKTASVATVTLIVTGLAQSALLDAGWSRAGALGVPLVFATVVAGAYGGYLASTRARPFRRALQGIADGDFETPIPPAPDRDLRSMRVMFESMRVRLRDLTRELRHADAQRRRLFSDLAHEIGTPTATLVLLAESLAAEGERAETAPGVRRQLELLDRETTRLERLVGDLRNLAAYDDPDVRFEMERVALGPIVRAAIARAELLGKSRGLTIEPRVEGDAAVMGDAARLEQTLANLLGNALRHARGGGRVRVGMAVEAREVVMRVEDDGAGVPEDVLPRLGERLFRGEASRARETGGSGLGLSIVAAIVQRHGGVLRFARSELGGLAATVRLPRAEGAEAEVTAA